MAGFITLGVSSPGLAGAVESPPSPKPDHRVETAAASPPAAAAQAGPQGESVQQALCRLIDGAAGKNHVPIAFLTRLIWQESSFRSNAVSPAGAQGIAQFMPGTALERGLDDPFDPEKAIPASAALLADLARRFGNMGLAAAAYNGGPGRVAAWLAGTGELPAETQNYVLRITGRSADEWAEDLKTHVAAKSVSPDPPPCMQLTATLRLSRGPGAVAAAPIAPFALWGVQLAANFSKARALASFDRARIGLASVLGDTRPMIIGTRLRTRGTRAFYRVRVPAASRQEADAICGRIHAARGACVVLRS